MSDDSLAVSSGQKLTSFYDNSYFDSDSDENETSEGRVALQYKTMVFLIIKSQTNATSTK